MIETLGFSNPDAFIGFVAVALVFLYETVIIGVLVFHCLHGWLDRWETVKWIDEDDYKGLGIVWSERLFTDTSDMFFTAFFKGFFGFCILGGMLVMIVGLGLGGLLVKAPWVLPVGGVFVVTMLGLRKAMDLKKALKKHMRDPDAHKKTID